LGQHKKEQVLTYLCQLCAHGETYFNGIESIQWQTIHHENVWLIMKTLEWHALILQDQSFSLSSNLADVMKDQFYHQWKMLTINLHYVRALFNPYLWDEPCFHEDSNVTETLNCMLLKNINSSTNYTQDLNDFVEFVESQTFL
jgi:hypothetical protein